MVLRAIDYTYETVIYLTHVSLEMWWAIAIDFEKFFDNLTHSVYRVLARITGAITSCKPPRIIPKASAPSAPTSKIPRVQLTLPTRITLKKPTVRSGFSLWAFFNEIAEDYILLQLLVGSLAAIILGSLWLYILAIYII